MKPHLKYADVFALDFENMKHGTPLDFAGERVTFEGLALRERLDRHPRQNIFPPQRRLQARAAEGCMNNRAATLLAGSLGYRECGTPDHECS